MTRYQVTVEMDGDTEPVFLNAEGHEEAAEETLKRLFGSDSGATIVPAGEVSEPLASMEVDPIDGMAWADENSAHRYDIVGT